jgi:hypothetical protein
MIFYNSGYSNAPCCCVIHTVPLVVKFYSSSSYTSSGFSSWPPQLVSPPSLPFHSSIHHSLRILVLSVFSRGRAPHLHSSDSKLPNLKDQIFFGNSVETFSTGVAAKMAFGLTAARKLPNQVQHLCSRRWRYGTRLCVCGVLTKITPFCLSVFMYK